MVVNFDISKIVTWLLRPFEGPKDLGGFTSLNYDFFYAGSHFSAFQFDLL